LYTPSPVSLKYAPYVHNIYELRPENIHFMTARVVPNIERGDLIIPCCSARNDENLASISKYCTVIHFDRALNIPIMTIEACVMKEPSMSCNRVAGSSLVAVIY
jgi:hypothetical protein